jgi:protein-disulfide isomerase
MAEVDVRSFSSPPYTAETECIPPLRLVVVSVAEPAPLRVPAPIATVPSRKVTIPVGITPSVRETTDVNVTPTPAYTVAIDVVSDVVVSALATVWTSTADWLARSEASPP